MTDRARSDWQRSGVGSTGKHHPFRNRIARQVRQVNERNHEEIQGVTQEELMSYGISFTEQMLQDCIELSGIERFEGDHQLEHRGVDTVLSAYSNAFKSGNFEENSSDE